MVVTFTLAVNRKFAKPEDEKKTDFIYITAWNKTAEFCSKYFHKGQQVGITGRLEQNEYEDKDGKKISKTHVIAEEVDFAEAKREGQVSPTSNTVKSNVNDFSFDSSDDLPF